MRIGIIGAGHVGGTLARHFAAGDHEIAIANSRDPATLRPLLDQVVGDVRGVTAAQAADFGQVVVVSVPFGRHAELPTEGFAGKPVIDTTNYFPDRDGHFPQLEADRTTSSEMIQSHLPGARVVKAFNTMRWDHLRDYGRESGAAMRYGIPVAADEDGARRCVFELVEQIGFGPVDAGDLATGGRRLQPGGGLFLADLTEDELHERLNRLREPVTRSAR